MAFAQLVERIKAHSPLPESYMRRLQRMGAPEGHESLPGAPPDYVGMVMCMVVAIAYDDAVFAWFANDSDGKHLVPVIRHAYARIDRYLATHDPAGPGSLTDIIIDTIVAMEAGCTRFHPPR